MRWAVAAAGVLLVGTLGWSEWVHARSSGRRLGDVAPRGGREAIIVLGYRNRGRRANHINRYRLRAALRSIDVDRDESVIVLSGGAVGGAVAEADLLHRHLREVLGYDGPVLLDRTSTTTWQNIEHAIPLIEEFDVVKIASNSLHAEKARAHLWKQRPDLARRLVRAREHRLGEVPLLKPYGAVRGLWSLRSL